MKIVIIGSSIAGLSAADAALKANPEVEVHIYSEEADYPYSRPRLFELLADPSLESKLYLHPREWYEQHNIHMHMDQQVVHIHCDQQKISLANGQQVDYDKLILATGSKSHVPPIPGVEGKGVYVIWTMKDTHNFLTELQKQEQVVVIGGGLLGLEAAYQINRGGVHTIVLESFSRLLGRQMDDQGSQLFKEKVESLGIEVILEAKSEIVLDDQNQVIGVKVNDRLIDCKMVLIATGVKARDELALEADCEINLRIKANDHMMTNVENIYAAGDNVEVDGQWYGLWSVAQAQGKVAGSNAAGVEMSYVANIPPYILSTMDTKVMSMGTIIANNQQHEVINEDKEIFKYEKLVYQGDQLVGFIVMGDLARGMALRKELQ